MLVLTRVLSGNGVKHCVQGRPALSIHRWTLRTCAKRHIAHDSRENGTGITGDKVLSSLKPSCSQNEVSPSTVPASSKPRMSPIGIQMLSESLHKQIFSRRVTEIEPNDEIEKHLAHHKLWGRKADVSPDIQMQLPPMQGSTLADHLRVVGTAVAEPYLYNALNFAAAGYSSSDAKLWPSYSRRILMSAIPSDSSPEHTIPFEYPEPLQKIATDIFPSPKKWNSLKQKSPEITLPPLPSTWSHQEGWTRYGLDGTTKAVAYPDENDGALVFDVETCMREGPYPTLAVAASVNAWYVWISPRLHHAVAFLREERTDALPSVADDPHHHSSLIPFGNIRRKGDHLVTGEPRIIIGHRISYDRARILDEYHVNDSRIRFLDTMSLNMAVIGESRETRSPEDTSRKESFCAPSSSLKDLMAFHFDEKLEKEERDVFVKGTLVDDIAPNFQSLVLYCVRDVFATYRLYSKLLPLYFHKCPHPVSFAGMLEMNSCYLPVDTSWYGYVAAAQKKYEELSGIVKNNLKSLAMEALKASEIDEATGLPKHMSDPWLCDLDWTTTPQKMTKARVLKDGTIKEASRPVKRQRLAGYPAWFKKLCPTGIDEPNLLTTRLKTTPSLLRLQWRGYPVRYIRELGWGFIVPIEEADKYQSSMMLKQFSDPGPRSDKEVCFFRIPHRLGDTFNCGNPLAKDYVSAMENRILTSQYPEAASALHMNVMCSYWVSVQRRVKSQFVVLESDLLKSNKYPMERTDDANNKKTNSDLSVLPAPAALANSSSMLGFDVRPHDYHEISQTSMEKLHRSFEVEQGKKPTYIEEEEEIPVDNDVDDPLEGIIPLVDEGLTKILEEETSTPIDTTAASLMSGVILPQVITAGTVTRRAVEATWMTASNIKKGRVGSELKAKVIAPLGFSLVGADVDSEELWIAALLGDATFKMHGATALGWQTLAGTKAEGTDLHSVSANILGTSRDNAKIFNYARIYGAGLNFAIKLLRQFNRDMSEEEATTKATELYTSTKGNRMHQMKDGSVLNDVAVKKMTTPRQKAKVYANILHSKWVGGSESFTFNRLEEIAMSAAPRTPTLECEVCEALHPINVKKNNMTSRINWVVQSSGVDYLHLLTVSMQWLQRRYNIKMRLCLTIHDELRYLVKEEDAMRAALALQISNIWTRGLFVDRLGLNDLPLAVAFFSAIDVDWLMRKEVTLPCITPSQEKTVPLGKAFDIYHLLESTNNGNVLYDAKEEEKIKLEDLLRKRKHGLEEGQNDENPADDEKDELSIVSEMLSYFANHEVNDRESYGDHYGGSRNNAAAKKNNGSGKPTEVGFQWAYNLNKNDPMRFYDELSAGAEIVQEDVSLSSELTTKRRYKSSNYKKPQHPFKH